MSPSHRYYTEYLTGNGCATLAWTGSWHVRAIVPCCNCGWHGDTVHDDDAGRGAALQQWQREHLVSCERTALSK
jgi:hypothetical protein